MNTLILKYANFKFICIIIISLFFVRCTTNNQGESINKVSPGEANAKLLGPITTPWLGFGYNQHPIDRKASGADAPSWTPVNWDLTVARMDALKPSFVRVVAYVDWFNPSGDVKTYNWDSNKMLQFYKVMDYYKSKGIPVMTGFWHSNLYGQDNPKFYVSTGPASFQQLQVDFMNHLLKVKQYNNIKWYTPTNEPIAVSGLGFDKWSLAIKNIHAAFKSNNLPTDIIVGADSSREWTPSAALSNNNELMGYDFHYYTGNTGQDVISGSLQNTLKDIYLSVKANDPTNKPVIISESGFTNTIDYWYNEKIIPEITPSTPLYGLLAIDYAIQAANTGISGSLAWCLDGYDYNKDSGMWQISGQFGGIKLRPWYYTWSLMSRYFQAGGIVYPIDNLKSGMRGTAFKQNVEGGKSNWSIALVNYNGKNINVNLNIPGWAGGTFSRFAYSIENPGDGVSLSLPSQEVTFASLQNGFTIVVPANGAVVLTSIGHKAISQQ